MNANRRISVVFDHIALACGLSVLLLAGCQSSCTGKPATQPLPPTQYTAAARAADDIAEGIKLLVVAESNLEQQKLLTPQEGLRIIDGLAALQKANGQFIRDIEIAQASGSKTVAVASGKAVVAAVSGLAGLTIKNPQARQTYDGIMAGVNLAIGVVSGFVQ